MYESVAQNIEAFRLHLKRMENNQRQMLKVISDGSEEDGLEGGSSEVDPVW